MNASPLTAAQARTIASGLQQVGVRFWIIGGWGIDALIGRQTRNHHDLDLLVAAADLPPFNDWLNLNGFARAYEWQENTSIGIHGSFWDTAFVTQHPDGRELDIHGVHVDEQPLRLATTDPWALPDDWASVGNIAATAVPCVSAQAQRAMHRGYELPPQHIEDLRHIDDK